MAKYNKPEDMSELQRWIDNPITQWYFEVLLEQFDPHKRILYADAKENVGELKGEQTVMKYIRNPGELM